jgi:glyoxylase-like metal-dependent hydrolase (beta-lactamase superfamily II)
VFVGDTLFMPDYGTARCDFPKGSAAILYDSVCKLFELPEDTRVFLCHDYLPESRHEYQCESSIKLQKLQNIHVHIGIKKSDFVEMRQRRDAKLGMPKLILPSIQINLRGGYFPQPEANGIAYLKIPFNYFK